MAETSSLENRVALVTGGSRGIGRAVALELAGRGAAVVVNYNKSSDAADEVVKQIQEAGGKAAAFQADVSDFKQAEALVKFAIETFGDLSILVNNAGITKDTLIMMMSEADWDAVINTNLKSTFNCSKAAVRHMMRKRYGRIVNMSSVSAQRGGGVFGKVPYSSAKAAILGFTKSLAREIADTGVTVNAVTPGAVDTNIRVGSTDEQEAKLARDIPIGRTATTEEVAAIITFLSSDDASYLTGTTVDINGASYVR